MLRYKKLFSLISIVLVLSVLLNCSSVYVNAENFNIDEDDSVQPITEFVLPDLGLDIKTVSNDDIKKIKTACENMTTEALRYDCAMQIQNESNYVQMTNIKNQALVAYNNYEKQILELGAKKLNDEQKLKYVLSVSELPQNDEKSSTAAPNYPDLDYVDFFIYEYTITSSDGVKNYMAQCIATPVAGYTKMIRKTSWVTMCEETIIKDIAKTTFKMLSELAISYVGGEILGQGKTALLSLIWGMTGSTLPAQSSTYSSDLTLRASSSSIVVHYWHKVNGTYKFKLATSAAKVAETWNLVKTDGGQYNKTNEYWLYSKYYVEGGDAWAISIDTYLSYNTYVTYRVKIGSSFVTRVKLTPYHASTPSYF